MAGGNTKWCNHCGKIWQCLKKLNIELPYDPAIPLCGRQPKEMKTDVHKNLYTNVHTTSLIPAKTETDK